MRISHNENIMLQKNNLFLFQIKIDFSKILHCKQTN